MTTEALSIRPKMSELVPNQEPRPEDESLATFSFERSVDPDLLTFPVSNEKNIPSTEVIKRLKVSKTKLIRLRKKTGVEPVKRRKKDPQLYSETDVLLMLIAKKSPPPTPVDGLIPTLQICAELDVSRDTLRKVRVITGLEKPKVYRRGRYYTEEQRDTIADYIASRRATAKRIAPNKAVKHSLNQMRSELITQHSTLAERIAIGKFKDPSLLHIAQSAVHEAALKFDETRGSFAAFTTRVVNNKILDELRRRKTSNTTTLDPNKHQQISESVEDRVTNKLFIQEIVDSLTPDQRQIIKLIFFTGLTYVAASKILKVPEGTLKRRVQQAVKNLRKHPHINSLKD